MIARLLDDMRALTPPLATTCVGVGLTLAEVQTILGIIAAVIGIIGTVLTILWRYREHKRVMGDG